MDRDDLIELLCNAIGDLRCYEFRLGKGEGGTLSQRADDEVARIWDLVGQIETLAQTQAE